MQARVRRPVRAPVTPLCCTLVEGRRVLASHAPGEPGGRRLDQAGSCQRSRRELYRGRSGRLPTATGPVARIDSGGDGLGQVGTRRVVGVGSPFRDFRLQRPRSSLELCVRGVVVARRLSALQTAHVSVRRGPLDIHRGPRFLYVRLILLWPPLLVRSGAINRGWARVRVQGLWLHGAHLCGTELQPGWTQTSRSIEPVLN